MKWTLAEARYSPLGGAIGSTIWVATVLFVLPELSGVGRWWYWGIVGLPLAALILHLRSSRVLYVQLLGSVSLGLMVVATGALLYRLAVLDLHLAPSWIGVTLTAAAVVLVCAGMIFDRNSALRALLPCGWDGKLDERTGIVDPNAESPASQAIRTRSDGPLLLTILLVATAVSQALLPAMSSIVKTAILDLALLFLLGTTAQKTGRLLGVIQTTMRWERKHGKEIHVLRPGKPQRAR